MVMSDSVLVLDDDVEIVHEMRHVLQRDGFEVEAFVDPATVLARLDAMCVPDVLLVDRQLGGVDGLDVISEIRERLLHRHRRRPSSCFILMSGDLDPALLSGTLALRVDDFLLKPFSSQVLVAACKRAAALQRLRRRADDADADWLDAVARSPGLDMATLEREGSSLFIHENREDFVNLLSPV